MNPTPQTLYRIQRRTRATYVTGFHAAIFTEQLPFPNFHRRFSGIVDGSDPAHIAQARRNMAIPATQPCVPMPPHVVRKVRVSLPVLLLDHLLFYALRCWVLREKRTFPTIKSSVRGLR